MNIKANVHVMNWEIGIDIYTLICIKGITNKNLLYKKINKIQKLKKKKIDIRVTQGESRMPHTQSPAEGERV